MPGNCGYYAVADEPLPASRRAHDHHQFVTLEFSREHLQKQFVQNEADLEPEIRRIIFGDKDENVVAPARPMTMQQRSVVASLAEPPVAKAAQILWYQGKALELMAHFLFAPKDPEFFCMRQKRVARERVERAKELLARDLANPPTLEMLGQEVGCSPFYLEPDFFARSRSDDSAIFAQPANGTRGRAVAHRPLQRHRSRDRSWLLEPESFQQSILRNDRLLPGALSGGQECHSRSLTRSCVKR